MDKALRWLDTRERLGAKLGAIEVLSYLATLYFAYYTSRSSRHIGAAAKAMALPFKPGLLPSEVAFLCEMELVTVIPRQRLASLELLGVSASSIVALVTDRTLLPRG